MKDPRMKSAYMTVRYYAFPETHNLYKIVSEHEKREYRLFYMSTESFNNNLMCESNKFNDVYSYLVSIEGFCNE